MPQQDVSIARYFADLPDPRVDRTKKHSLGDQPSLAQSHMRGRLEGVWATSDGGTPGVLTCGRRGFTSRR